MSVRRNAFLAHLRADAKINEDAREYARLHINEHMQFCPTCKHMEHCPEEWECLSVGYSTSGNHPQPSSCGICGWEPNALYSEEHA